jgi:hypothetical protein
LGAIAALKSRAEEAEDNYRFMVERACDEKLDGYRELGARAAEAENNSDDLRAQLASVTAQRDRAQLELSRLQTAIAAVLREVTVDPSTSAHTSYSGAGRAESRPACVPVDAPYTILPSGLMCWRDEHFRATVSIEKPGKNDEWWNFGEKKATYESLSERCRAAISPADFHAARVFMGWEKP